ncbi:MAG: PAS domain S-box protein [Bacteroidia bacterium]|nr:PAS domain S-box protein [Bacteroidia bacterium]
MKKDKELLDALFENATEGIIVTDRDGKIVLANPKAIVMFGDSDLTGKTVEEMIPLKHRKAHLGHREGYVKDPHSRVMGKGMDLMAVDKNGKEFPVEISLSHFKTSDGEYIMSFIIDISDRKRSERDLVVALEQLRTTSDALAQLNRKLESKVHERTEELAHAIRNLAESKREVLKALEREKQLNELKSRFVTMASHEFRTPLGTILSSVSLIARYEKVEDSEKRSKHVLRIKSAVQNLTEILNDFLSLDKLEEGAVRATLSNFDLKSFLEEVIDEIRIIAKKGQTIRAEFHQTDCVIRSDRQILKNVMNNLVSNAIKYSPEDTEVLIKTSPDHGKCVYISVTDKGIGIPEEDQPYVFDRFFRAGNSTNIQGTGLGLNIVKKYTEVLGGDVSFNSRAGEGTTFTLNIPIT